MASEPASEPEPEPKSAPAGADLLQESRPSAELPPLGAPRAREEESLSRRAMIKSEQSKRTRRQAEKFAEGEEEALRSRELAAQEAEFQRAMQRMESIEKFRADVALTEHPEATQRLREQLSSPKPANFWPRFGYFSTTYAGAQADSETGQSAHPFQRRPLDTPPSDALALSLTSSHTQLSEAQRVFLSIELQGSERFGWRRPPIDLFLLVADPALMRAGASQDQLMKSLLGQLDPRDRLSFTLGGEKASPLFSPNELRQQLIQGLGAGTRLRGQRQWTGAFEQLSEKLEQSRFSPHRVPATQLLLLILPPGAHLPALQHLLEEKLHALQLQGVISSVVGSGDAVTQEQLLRLSRVGHGQLHLASTDETRRQAIEREFEAFSRVVARLLRLNLRLSPRAQLIRILGARRLGRREQAAVKAREEAMDQQLSRRLGLKSDRGDDDDGMQTVIPQFLGGDQHRILAEIWVDGPGPVAEISLRYKDMVRLQNGRQSAALALAPGAPKESAALSEIAESFERIHLGEALLQERCQRLHPARQAFCTALSRQRGIAQRSHLARDLLTGR
ncbi:MAG: hypothetical protein VYD19_10600 [Myxococcota bacterium]|nr:hypothetical protein [Myxococcota bacterium]